MAEFTNYLESHRNLRIALLSTGFVIASASLFMAIATYLFIQYSSLQAAGYLLLALVFDVGIAWLVQQSTHRSFWLTIVFTSAAITAGAVVVSTGVWRGHWAGIVKELLRELG